jgi:hypothetical protein
MVGSRFPRVYLRGGSRAVCTPEDPDGSAAFDLQGGRPGPRACTSEKHGGVYRQAGRAGRGYQQQKELGVPANRGREARRLPPARKLAVPEDRGQHAPYLPAGRKVDGGAISGHQEGAGGHGALKRKLGMPANSGQQPRYVPAARSWAVPAFMGHKGRPKESRRCRWTEVTGDAGTHWSAESWRAG